MILIVLSLAPIAENKLFNVTCLKKVMRSRKITYSNKKRKGVLCAAIIFSLLIEITQLLFALGSTDVDDLIFNVLGAYIGYFVSDTEYDSGI